MRRRVFFDRTTPAAVAAAALAPADVEMAPYPENGAPDEPDGTVVLVGPGSTIPGGPTVRLIGLIPAEGPHLARPDWYAVLPESLSSAVLATTLRNALTDLDAAAEVARLGRELAELNAIGIRLSAERDPHRLLDLILTKAREITRSDAGSLYLLEDDEAGGRRLRFALAQNDSLSVPFESRTMPLSRESIAGWVALERQPLNLDDAYAIDPDAPFRFNRGFDIATGYRSKSMLVVPMQTPQGDVIGVLQLINCAPTHAGRLDSPETVERHVVPFSARFVALASSLASQAAVALENSRLYESVRALFDGFVRASVVAIESRDPTTAGHSFRVADVTVALAEAVERTERGRYADVRFTADDLMELRYASLLHDFGKVGVREHVLVKAKKLLPEHLDRIHSRVELLKVSTELALTRRKLHVLLEKGAADYEVQAPVLDAELSSLLAELDAGLARIVELNEPSVVVRDPTQQVAPLAQRVFEDHLGRRFPLITPEEAEVLAIARGSLTPAEYKQITDHVVHTWEFLIRIPWTREFRRVPEIARSHHEKLDGTGYPHRLSGDAIPLQSRMMAIADIYDALTAFDRPYKPAVSLETALDILQGEVRAGKIDGDLMQIFIDAKSWEAVRRQR